MSLKEEDISPNLATQMLATSYGNRPISQPAVLEYAVVMDSGKWSPTASKIDIDLRDRLVNGHHRLMALVLCNKTIRMLVHRGVPVEDREVIDTGRSRSLNDLTSMYTRRVNAHNYNAALNICCNLVSRQAFRRPKLRTLDTASRWAKLFEDGLEYVVPSVVAPGVGRSNKFRNGYVSGAFAFAYKRNPSATKSFLKATMLGENIDSSMPAYTVRSVLLNDTKGRLTGGGGVPEITFKILSGLYATIKGQSYRTGQAGREGYLYFLEAYDNAQVKNLMEPFLKFTAARQQQISDMAKEVRDRGEGQARKSA